MTISSSTRKAGPFTGNGVTTVFPFTFKVFTTADLYVVLANTSSGVETVQTLTTNYTVSLNADQVASPGGNVTMLVAPPTGYTLTCTSQVAQTQSVDLQNAGGFYPAIINTALDKLTILIQQMQTYLSGALKLPLSASGVSATLPSPVAGQLLGWDGTGTSIINIAGAGSTPVSTAMQPVVAAATIDVARTALGAATAGPLGLSGITGAAASGVNTDITALVPTGGISLAGTNTNDSAAAGRVGEFIESSIPSGSATSITSGVALSLTSISLTAGDWDVSGAGVFTPAATTSITTMDASFNTTAATRAATPERFQYSAAANVPGGNAIIGAVPTRRFSLSSTTTIYLVMNANFTVSTMTVHGRISARRVR